MSAPVIGSEASDRRKSASRATSSGVMQAPGRHGRRSVGEPALALAERHRLHMPLGRRIDPADIDPVDPDAVEAMGVRRVLGQPGQRRLGRGVDRKRRRAAVSVNGEDIDDRARRAASTQVVDKPLHEKERRTRIDRVEPFPELEIRFRERSAIGQCRRN